MITRSEIYIKKHSNPSVLVYKRRSDIKEVDITEFRVCIDYPNECV